MPSRGRPRLHGQRAPSRALQPEPIEPTEPEPQSVAKPEPKPHAQPRGFALTGAQPRVGARLGRNARLVLGPGREP